MEIKHPNCFRKYSHYHSKFKTIFISPVVRSHPPWYMTKVEMTSAWDKLKPTQRRSKQSMRVTKLAAILNHTVTKDWWEWTSGGKIKKLRDTARFELLPFVLIFFLSFVRSFIVSLWSVIFKKRACNYMHSGKRLVFIFEIMRHRHIEISYPDMANYC